MVNLLFWSSTLQTNRKGKGTFVVYMTLIFVSLSFPQVPCVAVIRWHYSNWEEEEEEEEDGGETCQEFTQAKDDERACWMFGAEVRTLSFTWSRSLWGSGACASCSGERTVTEQPECWRAWQKPTGLDKVKKEKPVGRTGGGGGGGGGYMLGETDDRRKVKEMMRKTIR